VPTIGRLRYLEALPRGSERPRGVLVLIHAFPLNAHMWEGQLALADSGWRVIAPHLRGFDGGITDPPAASIDDYAGDVIDLLDALHVKQAVVGGVSMGGYVAFGMLRYAARYIQALILADTRSQADTPDGLAARARMLQLIQDKGPAGVAEEMIPKLLGTTTQQTRPAVVEHVRSLALANPAAALAGATRAMMTRPDSTPLLASIHVPTLIVVGEEDMLTPPAASEEMHAAIAGSKLVRIPQAGHQSILEQPERFTAALAAFLAHRV
jgi:pimeloyl-ACP methyl ester carboxylesterase